MGVNREKNHPPGKERSSLLGQDTDVESRGAVAHTAIYYEGFAISLNACRNSSRRSLR